MIGQTVSHYHIIEKLGEGGMGVVYKAHDTKLDRDVALKFLPHHLTATPEEQARFLQEARAASALNHPNICAIYSIGEEGEKQFIEMEYVDGKTLRQLVPIQKIQTAIDYAIQIGEALQEAHSKGIVHRDIKADNIMVNSKNQIKVMDFGLAKLKGSLKLTKTSSTVGTLAYMAPEQIQGGEVDARSDIFSFGVVLYEMLTGHMPFRGEHEAAIVYSIVNEVPTPIERYLPEISSELIHVLSRALEKDPEDRYQSAHDMVIDLRRMKKQTTKVLHTQAIGTPASGVSQEPARAWSKTKILLLGVISIIAVASILLIMKSTSRPALNPNLQMTVLDVPFSEIDFPSLSPDGKWTAFPAADEIGTWDIYSMYLSGGQPRRITSDSSAPADMYANIGFSTSISPDGGQVAYVLRNPHTGMNEIRLVPSLGGTSRTLAEVGLYPRWRPDGQRIAYARAGATGSVRSISGFFEIWSVRPNGQDNRREMVDSLSERGFPAYLTWSADGKSIAWLRYGRDYFATIVVRNLDEGTDRELANVRHAMGGLSWTNNGMIVFPASWEGRTTIWSVPAEGGEPAQVTKEGTDLGVTVSDDGRRMLVYRRSESFYIWRAGIDGSQPRQLTTEDRIALNPIFSPDRQLVAYLGGTDVFYIRMGLYIADRNGRRRREIVPPAERADRPVWSPDGRWLAYSASVGSEDPDSAGIFIVDGKDFSGLRQISVGLRCTGWRDSRHLLFFRGTRTWEVDITTRIVKAFFQDSAFAAPVLNGTYVRYNDLRAGSEGRYLVPAGATSGSTKPTLIWSESEGTGAANAADGSMGLVWDDRGNLWRTSYPSGKRALLASKLPGLTRISSLTTSYDCKEIMYSQFKINAKLILVEDVFK